MQYNFEYKKWQNMCGCKNPQFKVILQSISDALPAPESAPLSEHKSPYSSHMQSEKQKSTSASPHHIQHSGERAFCVNQAHI
jgi:hypothetical protein